MIATIITIALAFYWLLIETDYLRVRLAICQNIDTLQSKSEAVIPAVNDIIPAKLNLPVIPLALPEVCQLTRFQKELATSKCRDSRRYGISYNSNRCPDSFQQMTIGNHIITLNASLWNLYDLIAEVRKALTEKPRKPAFRPAPLPQFIEQVRLGSHIVSQEASVGYKANRGWSETVNDYKTVFNDCVCGKAWLKKHHKDEYPEATIDITVDGGKSLSLNGEFRKGMIKSFMAEYCRPGEGKIRLVKVR